MPYAVWYTQHQRGDRPNWGRANMYIRVRREGSPELITPVWGMSSYFHIPAISDRGQFEQRVEAHAYALWRLENTSPDWTDWEIREEPVP